MTEQMYQKFEEDVFVFPASYAQQRLWFLDQFEPNSPFYNIPSAIRFKGELNREALEKGIQEIVARHETLRTTFAAVSGKPVQVIHPTLTLPVTHIDLRRYPEAERMDMATQLAREEARRPFNLSIGPLVRVTILELDDQDHVVLLTMHHIISDGWSMGVLIREMAILYDAFSHGRPSPLPELEIQYADFAEWQQQHLTGDVLNNQLNYWIQQLGDNLSVLELPTDRPRPMVQSSRGSVETLVIPKSVNDRLNELAKKHGATLFMSLLAGFQVLLHRYSGQEDFCIGSPIANRNRSEIEGLIGFFVNTIVLRSRVNGAMSFIELLKKTKETTLGAYAHQDVPFEKLVEALQPERDTSHTSLFQVMFSLQNTSTHVDVAMPQVHLSTLDVDAGTATFDISLLMVEESAGLSASIEYNSDLFDAATIQRMLNHFHIMLQAVLAQPELPLSKLHLLTSEEQRQSLKTWNQTEEFIAGPFTLHERFEQQAARTPDAVAVIYESERLTYKELNEKANRFARYLQTLGAGPETIVGVSVERSLNMVVALFGILKTGAAYLPLDPNYPRERLALMLDDSRAPILVTQKHLFEQFADVTSQVVCIDAAWKKIAGLDGSNLNIPVDSKNMAYCIYTSGSTGRPKGVMLTHSSAVNHNISISTLFRLSSMDHVLQFATINFDAAVEEIFPTLAMGATLVLRNNDLLISGADLLRLIDKERLTVLDLPTAYWHEWVTELTRSKMTLPESLRLVILGGDKASPERFLTWKKLGGDRVSLVNTYGPTETTVVSTVYEPGVREKQSSELIELPIGRPIANTKIYILDASMQPVPVGVPGELYIGGHGLARGYLQRPELTAEKFVPDPFSNTVGARLYRTGDLVRYRPDGQIEFSGRVDFQLKIRGFRVEIGEVESALRKNTRIQDVAVIAAAGETASSEKRLVAYCACLPEDDVTPSELRDFLKAHLPEYMVPSLFVIMDALPKTPNGKLDRKALPDPTGERQNLVQEFIAPRNETEEKLAAIWRDILGIEKVGVMDNFFEIGGHSLLATQVMSRIRETFNKELPLRSIFEDATIAGLARLISLVKTDEPGFIAPPIVPAPRDGELPLSFSQQRLWFLDQLEPGSAAYNIPTAVRVHGALDKTVLHRCLTYLVQRHEGLRTNFREVAGRPVQVIAESLDFQMPEIDIRHFPKEKKEAEILRLADEDARKPFDLSADPLVRVTLIHVDDEEFVVSVTMHHIISDEWSTNILISEMAQVYDAFALDRPAPLPELTVQYADYAYWQQNWLRGEVLQAQLDYWKNQLAGSPPVLELPMDHPRPAVQTFNGSFISFELEPELSAAINALSEQSGTTLFMTLLAAFQAFLTRYSGQTDIVVGTPIANRTRVETESIIGFFINTLVLRTDLSGDPTFSEVLQRVREVALGSYAHQDVPFEKLVDVLKPERELSHSPLFQVMFVLQNTPSRSHETNTGLQLSPIESHSGTAKFDLTLFMVEQDDRLYGTLEYNTDLFEESTILRMARHFENLLHGIAFNPERTISRLPLLSESEIQRAVIEWNATRRDYPRDRLLIQVFEAQVKKTPSAIAVRYQGQELSYAALNQQANQLAHYLMKQGIGPEVMVGVEIERSFEMMVALLGILKAGGAYVPIDPSYPRDRVDYILSDSGIPILLTQSKLMPSLPQTPVTVVPLDTAWDQVRHEKGTNPGVPMCGENLAYMIYTSGSTGKPKGTLINHRGLINYLNWCLSEYPIRDGVGSLVHSSLAFDATVTGLFAPLLVGCTVTLAPETKDVEIVGSILKESDNYSIIKITPAHLELLGQQLTPEEAPGKTRAFIIGGENLTSEHIEFWRKNAPRTKLINEYGPTETVVGCMNYLADPQSKQRGSISIGLPIGNMQIYLLDSQLTPVPIGVPGEIYIGGEGVARGYHNRPDLTAERFIPTPFDDKPGARLYKSGDLARYLPDGNIEFLGRIDHQVKIRGYRIELGEIEAVLGQFAGIKEIVVVARPDGSQNNRLVAYYVSEKDTAVGVAELRTYLKERVPDYMVPAAFIKLDALPLTTNGKVDTRALPEPEMDRSEMETVFVAPRNSTEQQIAVLWAEILHLEKIGVLDNFFDLGGHSLLATQIMSRIRQTFEIDIPLRVLFESPTIAGLAEAVQASPRITGGPQEPPLVPMPRDERIQLSFAQQRLWFLDQLEPDSPFYNIPSAIRLQGRLDFNAFQQAITQVVKRHETLRTTFKVFEGEPYQVIAPESAINILKLDLTDYSEDEREEKARELAREEAQKPFNLSKGPLFRVTLIRLSSTETVVLFTMHHIISDGWSISVLIREVITLYQASVTNTPVQLPALPIQYADYAKWQRTWLQGKVLEMQLMYWEKQLQNIPSILELPTDYPRPAVQSFNGATHTKDIPRHVQEALEQLSRHYDVTMFMMLLAAFQSLLYRYTTQSDIVVGTPIANRNRAETEGLIGFFANTLVMRTDFSSDPTLPELLKLVREMSLNAYAHQDVPFEMLVERLQTKRDPSHTPLFQVMFVLQNLPAQTERLEQLTLSTVDTESGTANFDLTMGIVERKDGLNITIEFNTDLFKSSTISRMLDHFQTLLEGMVAEPEKRISNLPLLVKAEEQQLWIEWNATHKDYPRSKCIHELFESQVETTPNAIALVFMDQQLTFQELNSRANQLARFLRKKGVGPEHFVGVCVDRSIEMVVGMLGILKAGGAYLPMDPAYPKDRIRYMMEDSGVKVLLTQHALLDHLPENHAEKVCLDTDWPMISEEETGNLKLYSSSSNLAYIIYTSGSTGRPKGVMLQHRGLCNLTLSQIKIFRVKPSSRVLQFASFSFDASVSEVFVALLGGASLHLVNKETLMPGPTLIEYMQDNRISIITLPPSVLAILPEKKFPQLKTVVSAGEAVSWEIANRWAKGRRFVNGYGPTENTVCASMYCVDEMEEGSTPPIGRPIDNVQIYVLDRFLNLVPPGVPGELHIGGVGLARGYLNRPELTAEKFIPNPFSEDPGGRLYRSGDLVRYLPNGNIEFISRIDHQIKIRGFRIELEEIESVLGQHPGLKDVIVVVREHVANDKRIVAYYIPEEGVEITPSELQAVVRAQLPEYMLPSAFVRMESLPLTPNGKVDKKALPSPDYSSNDTKREYVAPKDTLELKLCKIWEEMLGVEKIGVQDNFFEVGGHSLLAVRLLSKIEQQFERSIPLVSLFQNPTIQNLAELLRVEETHETWSPMVELNKNASEKRLFLVHPSGGSVHWYTHLAQQLDPEMSTYGIQARGLDGKQELHSEIDAMASYYVDALLRVQPEGPFYIGGWSLGVIIAYEMAQQLKAMGHDIGLLAIFDQGPFVPVEAPEDDTEMLAQMFSHYFPLDVQQLRDMDAEERLKFVFKKAKKAGIIPLFISLKHFRHYIDVINVQTQAWRKYTIKTFPGKIKLFRSEDNRDNLNAEPDLGWGELAEGGVDVFQVSGDHLSMLEEPHVQGLAEQLKRSLIKENIEMKEVIYK